MEYGAHGLCISCICVYLYQKIGTALMQVLEHTISTNQSAMIIQINIVAAGSGNGYGLLWKLVNFIASVFDLAKYLGFPKWLTSD